MANSMIMMIFDGIGDRPVRELGGKTPLEVAKTPNLDRIASKGINGIMDTVAPGIIPGSDTGHLALLGYDPYDVYTGRGPFEAAGIGIEVEPGDIAFRCNFSTVEDGVVTDRRAGRIKEGTDELVKAVNSIDIDVDFVFEKGVEHRCVLIFKGDSLDSAVGDIDPHAIDVPFLKSKALSDDKGARRTAELLNEFTLGTAEVLREHPINLSRMEEGKQPANIVLSRGAGKVPVMRTLPDTTGMKCSAIAGIPLVKGVCRMAGMSIIDVVGATGGMDTDISAVYEATVSAVEDNDLVMVNIKGCDIAGHDGLAKEKVNFIEELDRHLEILYELEDCYIAFTGDHSTPVTLKDHSGDPLPLTISGPEVRTDEVTRYDENSCAQGALSRIRGQDLLNILKDLSGHGEKFGA